MRRLRTVAAVLLAFAFAAPGPAAARPYPPRDSAGGDFTFTVAAEPGPVAACVVNPMFPDWRQPHLMIGGRVACVGLTEWTACRPPGRCRSTTRGSATRC